jgi:hypothetical protein
VDRVRLVAALSAAYHTAVWPPEAFYFLQNLFDTNWEQAIFAFESRLRTEAAGVTGIHFVPGNPRTVMGGLAWYF